jgi:putative oxidoreductase
MNNFFDSTKPYSDLVGRILIAGLFLVAGAGKIAAYAGTQAYMQAAGVPGGLLPLVILVEVGGGLAIVLGLFTRPVALLMAGFSIVTALLFHTGHDQVSQIMLLKNFGLAGGFLFLVGNGAGKLSLDARGKK